MRIVEKVIEETKQGENLKTEINYAVSHYDYADRIGNLEAEAVGVVKGEKHFPVYEGNVIFKPLSKSKPFSTPFFAYAEVFWSAVINEYFMPAPLYHLAFCHGYEAETGKYYDYGTVVPRIYEDGEQLLNLLEFFRKYPDEKVDIDQYENYCMMFYDYRDILQADYFQEHKEMGEQLAMQILVSVLKGDQNYHYENIAFVCGADGEILRLAPMIDHEFSTYFMFQDIEARHMYWYSELIRSMEGNEVQDYEYNYLKNPKERAMMEKSAVCLHKNLLYIKEHFPQVTRSFIEKLGRLEWDMEADPTAFYLRENKEYPRIANSNAYLAGMARYKNHDEAQAKLMEEKYADKTKEINFQKLNVQLVKEIKGIIRLLKQILSDDSRDLEKLAETKKEDSAGLRNQLAEDQSTQKQVAKCSKKPANQEDKAENLIENQIPESGTESTENLEENVQPEFSSKFQQLENLHQNCTEENLWEAVVAFQNYPFYTASGLPFRYQLKIGKNGTYNKELLIDRRENSKTLSWSSVKMAFLNCQKISGVVKRPKALGDIRGISYIYPLLWKFGVIEVPEETARKMRGEGDAQLHISEFI